MTTVTTTPTPTPSELDEVRRANESGKQPVVFVHGLWLLDSSWDRWAEFFEDAGYAAVTPGWPDDPTTVEEARENPDVFANKSVGDVAAYQQQIIELLDRKPAVIGHSFGGLLAMMLAGRGLSAATVAIDAAGGRGVLPLPASALKAAAPVLAHPSNRHKAVALTFDQFRYGFHLISFCTMAAGGAGRFWNMVHVKFWLAATRADAGASGEFITALRPRAILAEFPG